MGFLGLEKPIEYTGMRIFDPTMSKMVLDALDKYFNAVYADYARGIEEMKEFKKEYGDFLTPILKDQEWYNLNVTGKIRNFIDSAYANGIDLTRSAEGRAAISRLINSIDVGSVAKLRSSAENAKEFLKARKQLEAAGLYNPVLAKYDGPDIDTYSTLDSLDENGNVVVGSGIWDKMSPTRITDMATFGNPYFEGMKPNVRKVSKNGAVYNIETITEEDLKGIANSHFNELVSTPLGNLMYQYYRDIAQQNGFSGRDADEKAREYFNSAVADGQRRRIYEKTELDDGWAERLKIAQGWKRIAQEDEKLRMEREKNSGSGSYGADGPTPLTRQLIGSVNQKMKSLLGVEDQFNQRTLAENINDIINYYLSKLDLISLQKGKKVQDGYELKQTRSVTPFAGASSYGVTSQYDYKTPVATEKVPKYKYEYDGTNDPEYQKYKKRLDMYKQRLSGEYNPLTKQEQALYDKLKDKKELNAGEMNIMRHLAKKVARDNAIYSEMYRDDFYRMKSNTSKGGDNFAKANDEFYGMFEILPQDKAGVLTALGVFVGNTEPREIKGLPGKYNVVDFSQAGIEYAPTRKASISGSRVYKYNSLLEKFSRFLKSGVEGYLINGNAKFATIPEEYSMSGGMQIDAIAKPSITREEFSRFYNSLPHNMKIGSQEVARQLGLVPRDIAGTIMNQDKDGYIHASYYDVPSIRTVDNNEGFAFSQIDDQYNKHKFGESKEFDMSINSEAASLTPIITSE